MRVLRQIYHAALLFRCLTHAVWHRPECPFRNQQHFDSYLMLNRTQQTPSEFCVAFWPEHMASRSFSLPYRTQGQDPSACDAKTQRRLAKCTKDARACAHTPRGSRAGTPGFTETRHLSRRSANRRDSDHVTDHSSVTVPRPAETVISALHCDT